LGAATNDGIWAKENEECNLPQEENIWFYRMSSEASSGTRGDTAKAVYGQGQTAFTGFARVALKL
jgi:hypothetical protein